MPNPTVASPATNTRRSTMITRTHMIRGRGTVTLTVLVMITTISTRAA